MPDPSREEVVAAFFAAMNAHDGDAAAALVDPTVEIALGNHVFAGQQAVRELAAQRDPQLEFETIPLSFAGGGDQVEVTARRVQRWRTSGEIASEADVHARFVFSDGVITHVSLSQAVRFEAQTLEQHPLAYLLGLQVRRCEEPRRPCPLVDDGDLRSATGEEFPEHVPDAPPNIWALHRWCPAATNAAYRDSPAAVIWHFQLDAGNGGGT